MAKESEKLSWPLHISSPLNSIVVFKAFQRLSCLLSRRVYDSINMMKRKNLMTCWFFFLKERRREKEKKRKGRCLLGGRGIFSPFYSSWWKLFLPPTIYLWRLLYVGSSWLRSQEFSIDLLYLWMSFEQLYWQSFVLDYIFKNEEWITLENRNSSRGWRRSRG